MMDGRIMISPIPDTLKLEMSIEFIIVAGIKGCIKLDSQA